MTYSIHVTAKRLANYWLASLLLPGNIHIMLHTQVINMVIISNNTTNMKLEAIRCYTINGAYASFEEDIKGSIEVGKLADFALLSEDILSYPQDKVQDIQIDMTMIDGEVVYERNSD